MSRPALILRFLCVSLLSLLSVNSACAVVLDWDAATWTPGYSNSFDVDLQTAGNDVTVSVAGDVAALRYNTPALATQFQGGLGTAEKTLVLGVDFANQAQFITVTVDFSSLYLQGVENVSFTIFDVDYDNAKNSSEYQDQLRSIVGLSVDGLTPIAPTITTSASNTASAGVVNGLINTADAGPTSGNANVTINFGTNAISSFTFRYGSGSSTDANPTYQHIGIHDLSFTPVPEINPALTAALSCFAAAGLMIFHRARVKSRRQ